MSILSWDHIGDDREFSKAERDELFRQIDEEDTKADLAIAGDYEEPKNTESLPYEGWTKSLPVKGVTSYMDKYKKSCIHYMQEVALEQSLCVYASAWRDAPYKREAIDTPDLGIYLSYDWARGRPLVSPGLAIPPWGEEAGDFPLVYVPWPDYGTPDNPHAVADVAVWTLQQIAANKVVETGCMGGHGRTGTFLACLLAAQGIHPGEAIRRVRDEYCSEAVETDKQCDLVASTYAIVTGDIKWRRTKKQRKLFYRQRDMVKYVPTVATSTYNYGSSRPATTTPGWSPPVPSIPSPIHVIP